jgi:hypothetical protein
MKRDLSAPLHSLDPADWWMYSDLLQESGAEPFLYERARRIGDSLSKDVKLTLVLTCSVQGLERHWLRVAKTWFIPVNGTHLPSYKQARWFRPEWISAGFKRYPYDKRSFSRRSSRSMIRFASGTPWSQPCKTDVLELYGPRLIGWFFYTHSRLYLPPGWE